MQDDHYKLFIWLTFLGRQRYLDVNAYVLFYVVYFDIIYLFMLFISFLFMAPNNAFLTVFFTHAACYFSARSYIQTYALIETTMARVLKSQAVNSGILKECPSVTLNVVLRI